MMAALHAICVILALACLFAAALEWHARKGNLLAAGLFLWLLSTVIGGAR